MIFYKNYKALSIKQSLKYLFFDLCAQTILIDNPPLIAVNRLKKMIRTGVDQG